MRKAIYIIVALLVTTTVSAQIERAAKSVFTLTTFSKDGSIIASTHGLFVGPNGEAIGTWTPFIGADHATIIDANGKQMEVESIIGANELYDVCKFRVAGKGTPAPLAKTPAKKGEKVWILHYSVKKPQIDQRNVQSTEAFMEKYTYYIFSSNAPENAAACPFVNAKGEVIGLLQHSKSSEEVYATDANFIDAITVPNGFAITTPVLKSTGIPVDFPTDADQAAVMLTLATEQSDSAKYQKYIAMFINRFPKAIEGYTALANTQISANDFEAAEATMQKALASVDKKDEAHAAYSRIVYQKQLNKPDMPFDAWSLDKALDEAKAAYTANAQPLYRHQQAQILYTKGEYQTAYDMFIELTGTPLRNGDLYYAAAQCKAQLKAPHSEIMVLLDSAIAASPQPLNAIGAPYVLARGTEYFNAGEYRKAVTDFNQYDTLMLGRPINSDFYYMRHKAEMQIHQYQQALNDIDRAILLRRDDPTLWAEKASLHLRFNQLEKAIQSASVCTKLAPEYADGYIVLGVANMLSNNKEEGTKALEKAKELGDARAEEYLKKYK